MVRRRRCARRNVSEIETSHIHLSKPAAEIDRRILQSTNRFDPRQQVSYVN